MAKNWDGSPGMGCLGCVCNYHVEPSYTLGGGPLCNLGAALDIRYLKRMQKLLSGEMKSAVIKFRGISTTQQLHYFPSREEMVDHLKVTLHVVISIRRELKLRHLLKAA